MKSFLVLLAAATVTALVATGFSRAARSEKARRDLRATLATLQYAAADAEASDVENSLRTGPRLPAAEAANADVRGARVEASYWQNYGSSVLPQEPPSLPADADLLTLLAAGNAEYHQAQATIDHTASLRRLDVAVKTYGQALRAPDAACRADDRACDAHVRDAAFNYEFAVRARDTLAKLKGTKNPIAVDLADARKHASRGGDLPAGPTLHGRPGGPPPATDMNDFKMVIPKTGEERKGNPDAGKGSGKEHKG